MIGTYEVAAPPASTEDLERFARLQGRFLAEYARELPALLREDREERARRLLEKEGLADKQVLQALPYLAGYGLIDPLFFDDDIEEILIDDLRKPVLVVHRSRGKLATTLQYGSVDEVDRFIAKVKAFAGVSHERQIIDAQLPENVRVNVTLPPTSFRTPSITIRKYLEDPPSIAALIANGTLDADVAAFLWMAVDGLGHAPRNIVVTGPASCGKTTLLNALLTFTHEEERIVSIEDTMELDLRYHEDWVRMKASDDVVMEELVKNSLRQRPDRVAVGEVRGREAYNLLSAMNLGIHGLGTIHANNCRDAVARFKAPPMNVPVQMLGNIDLLVALQRFTRESAAVRRVVQVMETGHVIKDTLQLGEVYVYEPGKDRCREESFPAHTVNEIADAAGVTPKKVLLEMRRRSQTLADLAERGVHSQSAFVSEVRRYYEGPEDYWAELFARIKGVKKTEQKKEEKEKKS